METFYAALFGACAILAAVFEFGNRQSGDSKLSGVPPDFTKFKNNYLLVYTMMMGTLRK